MLPVAFDAISLDGQMQKTPAGTLISYSGLFYVFLVPLVMKGVLRELELPEEVTEVFKGKFSLVL